MGDMDFASTRNGMKFFADVGRIADALSSLAALAREPDPLTSESTTEGRRAASPRRLTIRQLSDLISAANEVTGSVLGSTDDRSHASLVAMSGALGGGDRQKLIDRMRRLEMLILALGETELG